MKKLYLLLANGLVLFAGVGTLTLSVAGCDHKKKDDATTKIYDALNKFTKASPIEILYQTKTPTAPASDPAVTKVIRDQLKSKNPTIFTSTVVAEITFSNTPLQENTAVQVQATYKEQATPIYVKEAKNPDQGVYDALASFDQKHPLEIPYNQKSPTAPASDPVITGSIQAQLKFKNPIFTDAVVQAITFNEITMQPNTPVQVQATYKKQATPIYIKEAKNLDQGVYDVLATFDQKHPIEILYQTNPTAPASDPAVTKVIRDQLKSKNPTIFTSKVVAEITFSKTPLQENTAVEVQATYKGQATPIYVLEEDNSTSTLLINIFKKYNNAGNPVEINSDQGGKFADDYLPAWCILAFIWNTLPQGTEIRKIFSPSKQKVTFSHTQLKKGESVSVTASYGGKSATIFVFVKVKET